MGDSNMSDSTEDSNLNVQIMFWDVPFVKQRSNGKIIHMATLNINIKEFSDASTKFSFPLFVHGIVR